MPFFFSSCKQGDLIEFRLKPVYHPKNDFLCHMTLVPNQKLLELEYTIKHYYNTLMTQSFAIYGDETWQKNGKLKSEWVYIRTIVRSIRRRKKLYSITIKMSILLA